MKFLLAYSIGVLVFSGLYMMLSTKFWKVILGSVFLSHAVNLVLLASGGYFPGIEGELNPPVLSTGSGDFMDPLPQALILTAIVISFGITAFIAIVLRQLYHKTGTTNLNDIEEYEWRGESSHE